MGAYLNPSSKLFRNALNSKIFVDKSELIARTNALVDTAQMFACVSRPRRFGKSMALEMLSAYYGMGEDTHRLFDGLKIATDESYEKFKQIQRHQD